MLLGGGYFIYNQGISLLSRCTSSADGPRLGGVKMGLRASRAVLGSVHGMMHWWWWCGSCVGVISHPDTTPITSSPSPLKPDLSQCPSPTSPIQPHPRHITIPITHTPCHAQCHAPTHARPSLPFTKSPF